MQHNYKTVRFKEKIIGSRLRFFLPEDNAAKSNFAGDVKAGLASDDKFLPPKYFYDAAGSEYFEKICETPEYYLTRTEAAILKKYCGEIAEINSDKNVLIELGSGASIKTKFIINALLLNYGTLDYIPIDVSKILIETSKKLVNTFEKLFVSGILAEYEDGISVVNKITDKPKLFIFLGSSIGNFSLEHAAAFLCLLSSVMKDSDSLLIGFDLKKDEDILNRAYNDQQGFTEEFNLNLLKRINRELGGDFDLSKFKHRAFFNEAKNRVEMHIESTDDQNVRISGINETISFRKGERMHTENSYKFTREMISNLAVSANLKLTHCWKDEKKYFALCLLTRKSQ
jgi:L-histidine N-alpha-methyltransferase